MIFESPGNLSTYRKDAKSVNTHSTDVTPREQVNLNIDLAQMGVGGDNSRGAQTHWQYRLTARKYEYSFRIRPVTKEDDVLKTGEGKVLKLVQRHKGIKVQRWKNRKTYKPLSLRTFLHKYKLIVQVK